MIENRTLFFTHYCSSMDDAVFALKALLTETKNAVEKKYENVKMNDLSDLSEGWIDGMYLYRTKNFSFYVLRFIITGTIIIEPRKIQINIHKDKLVDNQIITEIEKQTKMLLDLGNECAF